jgi:hypothetical protein
MNILHLNVSEKPFQVMITGEKTNEYRRPSLWMLTRLFDKQGNKKKYTHVKITWGYGADRPYFICEFKYFLFTERSYTITYSTGFKVKISKGDINIKLGKIVENHKQSKNLFNNSRKEK